MSQRLIALFLCVTMTVSTATATAPTRQSNPNVTVINSSNLKRYVLSRNIDLLVQINKVHQAKQQVNIARGNLLPSVNLGTVVASGVSFGLAAVSVLLPFLLPSNWFNLRESQYLLDAQGTSYYIAQLNTYASAYSLYLTIVSDLELRDALYEQYLNAEKLEQMLKLPSEIGIISPEDYLKAKAQRNLAWIQVSQVDELLRREKASIREMLALPLTQEIQFERTHAPVSAYESSKPQDLIQSVLKVSPEYAQMNSMVSAAKYMKWSKGFSFLSGASLGATKSNGSFGDVTGTGSVNLGFGYFPALELSHLNLQALRLQRTALEFDHAQLLESTLASLEEGAKQYESAEEAYQNLKQVYETQLHRLSLGMGTIVEVLQTANSLTAAIANRVQAQSTLDAQRVNLHRMLLTDHFATVEKCKIYRQKSGGVVGKIGRIFNPDKDVTLDDVCGR